MGYGSPLFAVALGWIRPQKLSSQYFPCSGAIWVSYPMFARPFLISPLPQLWATYKHPTPLLCSEQVIGILGLSCMDLQLACTLHHVQYLAHYSRLRFNRHHCWEFSQMYLAAAGESTRMNSPRKAGSNASLRCRLPMGLRLTSIGIAALYWVYRTQYAYCNCGSPF